jgi:hypothetical protein
LPLEATGPVKQGKKPDTLAGQHVCKTCAVILSGYGAPFAPELLIGTFEISLQIDVPCAPLLR